MASKKDKGNFESALRVVSTIAGFRRGGVSHPSSEVTHPPGTFSEEQAQQILEEPALVARALTDAEWRAHQDAEKKAGKAGAETGAA